MREAYRLQKNSLQVTFRTTGSAVICIYFIYMEKNYLSMISYLKKWNNFKQA